MLSMDLIIYERKLVRCAGTGCEKGKHWKLKATDTWINKARRKRKHVKGS